MIQSSYTLDELDAEEDALMRSLQKLDGKDPLRCTAFTKLAPALRPDELTALLDATKRRWLSYDHVKIVAARRIGDRSVEPELHDDTRRAAARSTWRSPSCQVHTSAYCWMRQCPPRLVIVTS